jgi:hypothetical protein
MLDISGGKISAVKRGEPPCKLCFLVETENGVGSYAVIPVPRGHETEVRFALGGTRTEKRMLVLLLENACQRENFNIEHPHFFALREESKTRYFE